MFPNCSILAALVEWELRTSQSRVFSQFDFLDLHRFAKDPALCFFWNSVLDSRAIGRFRIELQISERNAVTLAVLVRHLVLSAIFKTLRVSVLRNTSLKPRRLT